MEMLKLPRSCLKTFRPGTPGDIHLAGNTVDTIDIGILELMPQTSIKMLLFNIAMLLALTTPNLVSAGECVGSCIGRHNGNYRSCRSCDVYVTCSEGTLYDNRPCPGELVWNDDNKSCDTHSRTCTTGKHPKSPQVKLHPLYGLPEQDTNLRTGDRLLPLKEVHVSSRQEERTSNIRPAQNPSSKVGPSDRYFRPSSQLYKDQRDLKFNPTPTLHQKNQHNLYVIDPNPDLPKPSNTDRDELELPDQQPDPNNQYVVEPLTYVSNPPRTAGQDPVINGYDRSKSSQRSSKQYVIEPIHAGQDPHSSSFRPKVPNFAPKVQQNFYVKQQVSDNPKITKDRGQHSYSTYPGNDYVLEPYTDVTPLQIREPSKYSPDNDHMYITEPLGGFPNSLSNGQQYSYLVAPPNEAPTQDLIKVPKSGDRNLYVVEPYPYAQNVYLHGKPDVYPIPPKTDVYPDLPKIQVYPKPSKTADAYPNSPKTGADPNVPISTQNSQQERYVTDKYRPDPYTEDGYPKELLNPLRPRAQTYTPKNNGQFYHPGSEIRQAVPHAPFPSTFKDFGFPPFFPSSRSSVVQSNSGCIQDCTHSPDGDFHSCTGCQFYATCTGGYLIDNRPCPTGLCWDDTKKRCERVSSTCNCGK